jgi:hypothetical protein
MSNYDWVFWLNVTNMALGVVVLLAVLVVAFGLVWELWSRRKSSSTAANLDKELNTMMRNEFAHSLSIPELGLTMADGGEGREPLPAQLPEKKHS